MVGDDVPVRQIGGHTGDRGHDPAFGGRQDALAPVRHLLSQ
jgi:hypothetical protein